MELKKEDYIGLYQKAENEPDLIRKIIMLHILDTVIGNNREDLEYVDVCYPCIENVLNVMYLDPIKNELRLPSSEDFENYFDQNYDYSYADFYNVIKDAKDDCEKYNDKNNIRFVEKRLEDAAAIVYSTKKINNVIDMNQELSSSKRVA